jgi:gliding motility-associated-like protein
MHKMRHQNSSFVFFILLNLIIFQVPDCHAQGRAQPVVSCDFTLPDTVCINSPVTITNLSQGASSYLWRFCPGNPLSFPTGVEDGNIPFSPYHPWGISMQQDGSFFYAFITNPADSSIVRVSWHTSLINPPSFARLSLTWFFSANIAAIRIVNDNGAWYGFVTDGSYLFRLDFGTSLGNLSPQVKRIVNSQWMDRATGLVVVNDGMEWMGFCTNFPAQTVVRFNWGNTLTNYPAVTFVGNVGGLTRPMQPALIQDSSGWYLFVANTTSLSELIFGNSLLNMPGGVNLGQLNWINDARGVSTSYLCNHPYVLVANHDVIENQLFQIYFPNGLAGQKTLIPLGSVGSMNETMCLSEMVTVGDTTFCISLNSTPTLTVICFPPCVNTTIPVSTQFDPSPVYFPTEGTYSIRLTVDAGLPTEQQACKEITVLKPVISLGNDTNLCEGSHLTLDAGSGFSSWFWSTGDTTRTITVDSTGLYSVTGINPKGCMAWDTIRVTVLPGSHITVDTSVCSGILYFAGGALQSTSGTYLDSLRTKQGCDSVITTHLRVKPEITLNVANDSCMNKGASIVLVASAEGANEYTWQDGSHDSTYVAALPGLYWVRVVVDSCSKTDSITIEMCVTALRYYVPNAFTPDGDGLNDVFRPVINYETVDFSMIIYDRWGETIFETKDMQKGWDGTGKGRSCEQGVYVYAITFSTSQNPENKLKITGTVTLVK